MHKAVRITVPVSVANNIDKYKGVIKETLGRMGCQACCSGHDIHIGLEREFVFNNQRLAASPAVAAARASNAPTVSLSFAQGAGAKIDSVFKGIDQLADRLGCRACCSGFDLFLRDRLELLADDAGKLGEFPGR